jgi:hypothetical protein
MIEVELLQFSFFSLVQFSPWFWPKKLVSIRFSFGFCQHLNSKSYSYFLDSNFKPKQELCLKSCNNASQQLHKITNQMSTDTRGMSAAGAPTISVPSTNTPITELLKELTMPTSVKSSVHEKEYKVHTYKI